MPRLTFLQVVVSGLILFLPFVTSASLPTPPAGGTGATQINALGDSLVYANHIKSEYETTADGGALRNMYVETTITGTHDTGTLAGVYAITTNASISGTITHMQGLVGRAYTTGPATVEQQSGIWGGYNVQEDATVVSNAYALFASAGQVKAGTVTRSYGLDVTQPQVSGSGKVVNNYGIRIRPHNVGVNNYSLYIEDPGPNGVALDIDSDAVRLRQPKTPESSDSDCEQGEIAWDEEYIYVCVEEDAWKRAGLASW